MNHDSISKAFNKFAGREVECVEETKTHHFKSLGDITLTEVRLKDPNDAVLQELRDEAAAMGLKLRVWLPGTMGTMDYRTDRLNVHVGKEADGKYRISPNIGIG